MKFIKNRKLLLSVFLTLAILTTLVIFAFIYGRNKTIVGTDSVLLQKHAYCSEEFLEKARGSRPSSEKFKKYQDCQPFIAFLKDNVSDSEAEKLTNGFKMLDGVYKVKYISKAEALKIYRERNKDNPLLTENIPEDFLPASIEVYVSDPSLKIKSLEFAKSNVLVERVIVP